MFGESIKASSSIEVLYNKIVLLSRNKSFFVDMSMQDTFQNKINLIFFHTCFLFVKAKQRNTGNLYKDFYQKIFDLIFNKIEINMRELGFGDVTVNKNMKFLVKIFYNILINCENFKSKKSYEKEQFICKYLYDGKAAKTDKKTNIIEYFDKYHSFCLDLTADKVLKGELNFTYK